MYILNGKKSDFAKNVQRILDEIELNTEPMAEDSFILLLFRTDMRDRYRYLIAYRGLREPETMFGIREWGSNPIKKVKDKFLKHSRTFRHREGISIGEQRESKNKRFDDHCQVIRFGDTKNGIEHGSLWISKRQKANWEDWTAIEKDVLAQLEDFFLKEQQDNAPLYPDLWYEEKVIRDSFRSSFRELGPMPRLNQTASVVNRVFMQNFSRLLEPNSTLRIGVYLFKGDGWQLCGNEEEPNYLPKIVYSPDLHEKERKGFDWFYKHESIESIKNENAFEYLHRSGLTLSLNSPVSELWAERLKHCGIEVPPNGNLCIAPLKDPFHQDYAFGLLLLSISNSNQFGFGHSYLLSRLCDSISNSMARLLPIPGYPYWPEGHVSRGGATVITDKSYENANPPKSPGWDKMTLIESIVKDLMPTGSKVRISPLTSGLSGTEVFLLEVSDPSKVLEIPRVLKIGSADAIGDELYRYVKYAHNKVVGGQSRVDIARGYPTKEWKVAGQKLKREATGVIVYTLVGAGERKSEQWNSWIGKITQQNLKKGLKSIEEGIVKVMQQLSIWHNRKREEDLKINNAVIDQWVLFQQNNRVQWETTIFKEQFNSASLSKPSIEDTLLLLKELHRCEVLIRGKVVITSIIHGDTHCNNIFSILDEDDALKNVALIDWGKVKSGGHPLTDLAILMSDLIFRVKGKDPVFDVILAWGEAFYFKMCKEKNIYEKEEAAFVISVHLLRMLAWRSMTSGDPWIPPHTRKKAWDWVNKILKNSKLPYFSKNKIILSQRFKEE